jgi:pyruvate dehydrogenase E2 component (dihydrolipoamide acetyltransferase)
VTVIKIPDIGGDKAEVIEILVKPGDSVAVDDSLVTLEGEKATMDVPASEAGVIKSVLIKVGDQVGEGDVVVELEGGVSSDAKPAEKVTETKVESQPAAPVVAVSAAPTSSNVHAGPAVRRIARELDIDLSKIKGTGDKGRITKADVKAAIAGSGSAGGGLSILPQPQIDFSKFGEIETQALSKIKKISGANLHRNWVSIPHITQFDDADITELEAFRQEQKSIAQAQGIRLTPLVFIMKAVVATLKEFPIFNSSLDASGENLIMKNYYHIGVAVDTPNGLVVPVIRDVDRKGIYDLAKELGEISIKAREKGLTPTDMQGGCFTISSLGGIGGTAFTPIINAPEVAILGVSRSHHKPVYVNGEFLPRLMLPLSLSYDHRVVDGADGARFIVSLAKRLSDIRKILL